jgi:WD40 repeat protein
MAFEDDILLFCHNATLIKYRFNLRLIDQSITNRPLHNGAVNQIAVTTLKKKIATTSGTELAVWHALTLFRLLYLNFDEEVGPILFTGDGSYLLVTLNNIIQLLDTTTGNKLRSVVVPVDSGMRVNDLVNYPYRHSIIIVRAREAAVEKTYLYDWKSDVLNVENFEREQRNLVVRIGRKLLQELDLIDRPMPDYALLYRDLKLRYQANLILFSPYRRFIFIYSQSLNLLLFLNFDGSERYRFNYESDGPNLNATFSRTGQFLAIIAEDGTTYVWSVMLKAVLFDLSFETHFATSVYWDAEDHFYVGAQDGAVYMYDLSEFNYFYHKLNSACCKPSLLVSEDLSRRTRASNNQASLYGTLTKHRHEEKLSPYEGSMEAYNPW